ncbi:MAG: hypothetical protein WCO06_05420 [Candidatus Roizmanbacteria bacterium]
MQKQFYYGLIWIVVIISELYVFNHGWGEHFLIVLIPLLLGFIITDLIKLRKNNENKSTKK